MDELMNSSTNWTNALFPVGCSQLFFNSSTNLSRKMILWRNSHQIRLVIRDEFNSSLVWMGHQGRKKPAEKHTRSWEHSYSKSFCHCGHLPQPPTCTNHLWQYDSITPSEEYLTAYLTPNICLSTPRLRYHIPKVNTHSWAASRSSAATL